MQNKIEKPELSVLDKKRANEIWRYMMAHDVVVKEQLCAILGWEYNTSNDRRIRELISILAKKVPIISTSDSRGYKIAKSINDLESVEHQWAELSKRAEEIMERCKPLIAFREKCKNKS